MATIEEKIEALAAKLKEAKAEKSRAEAKKKALLNKQLRADDTRRKVLLGSLMIQMMEKDPAFKNHVYSQLPSFLTRDNDKKLFNISENTTGE